MIMMFLILCWAALVGLGLLLDALRGPGRVGWLRWVLGATFVVLLVAGFLMNPHTPLPLPEPSEAPAVDPAETVTVDIDSSSQILARCLAVNRATLGPASRVGGEQVPTACVEEAKDYLAACELMTSDPRGCQKWLHNGLAVARSAGEEQQ